MASVFDTPELTAELPVQLGQEESMSVQKVQEWLCFQKFATEIDGSFGPATQKAVQAFQAARGLPQSGVVGDAEWQYLIAPLKAALQKISPGNLTLGELTAAYATQQIQQLPLEIGGDNRGPWVRLYCSGKSDEWCAGFATFVVNAAAETMGVNAPVKTTLGCQVLANEGKKSGRFFRRGDAGFHRVGPGSFFLLNQSGAPDTFYHCGLVKQLDGSDAFDSFEGNTTTKPNDGRGFEAITKTHSYTNTAFVVVD